MSDFAQLSMFSGARVDPSTGEILEVIESPDTVGTVRPGSYSPSKYPQYAIDSAREVTSELCEKIIAKITKGKRVKRGNNRGHDIVASNTCKIEAKVGRIGNSAVIKENQLFEFDANFWGFVFYRTTGNLPPSYYTSLKNKIGPIATLKRNISIEVAYLFPTEVMRYYWNTADVKRGIIHSTGITHRPFVFTRAEALIADSKIPGTRFENKQNYGRHDFSVKTIDFSL